MNNKVFIPLLGLVLVGFSADAQQEFSPEVQADLLAKEAIEYVDEEQWAKAAKAFEKIGKLDAEIPTKFYYLYGKSLCRSGEIDSGLNELMLYLVKLEEQGAARDDAALEFLVIAKNVRVDKTPLNFPKNLSLASRAGILLASIKYNESHNFTENCLGDYEQLKTMDVDLPDDFLFLYGRTLFKLKRYAEAQDNITSYVNETGRSGAYYKEALELILDCKEKLN